jgi:cytidylate kinase
MWRHIALYGPPGAGKLTVARCLAVHYGVKVLDNTLTVEAALRLFDFGTEPFVELVERLRLDLLDAAGRAGVDVVSTFVYAHPVDRDYVDRLVQASEVHGGVMTFVQLRPSRSVLEHRVDQPSRAEVAKVRDVAQLRRMLDRYDLTTPIHDDDLSIDNSSLSPEDVASRIAQAAGGLSSA